MMARRVSIKWTRSAKEGLGQLPRKVRTGFLEKIDGLYEEGAVELYKPLKGPLQGFYSIVYSRYRAIFTVEEEKVGDDEIILHVKIVVVTVGIRKERDKKDVYKIAQKLVEMQMLEIDEEEIPDEPEIV